MTPLGFASALLVIRLIDPIFAESVRTVWAPLGSEAKLSCPFTARVQGDRAIIILWSRAGNSETIYSYDARETGLLSGRHWQNEELLGTRAHFTVISTHGDLTLKHVKESDHGTYTCRVEYQYASPSYTKFRLSVIVPPEQPIVLWKGQEVMGILTPIAEGEEVQLTCQTSGGFPTPSITWLIDGQHMDAMQKVKKMRGATVVSSEISLAARRHIHMVSLVCQALPTNPVHFLSIPQTISVRLNLTLPPTSVEITGLSGPISAETTKTVECLAFGSSPPAEIELWKGDRRLSAVTRTVLDGGNVTKASVSIQIRRYDHRSNITCKASNPSMGPHSSMLNTLTDVIALDVYYEPEVRLQLGKDTNPSQMLEGQTAFLQCLIQANPPTHLIQWLKEGSPISQRPGIVLSGASLTLPKMDKSHSGIYRCSAQNLEGKTLSNGIEINVKYSPVCSVDGSRTNGVAMHESAKIMCRVNADPWNDLKFTWHRILRSGAKIPVDPSSVSFVENVSYFTVTPNRLEDFGKFACAATNVVGPQRDPCIITLAPAGPPEAPFNCSKGLESGAVTATCEEGFDGGLPQQFHLEVWQEGELLRNISEEFPAWKIEAMETGVNITLKFYSSNAKGKSPPVVLEVEAPGVTRGSSISDMKYVNEENKIESDLLIILGSAGGFILMLILILLVMIIICCRRRRRKIKSNEGIHRDCSSPDVISSTRNQSNSPHLDVLEHARIVHYLSSCDVLHERGRHSCSNSSLESNNHDGQMSLKNPHMHSVDFALDPNKPSGCCNHHPRIHYTLQHPHTFRQISASDNQLSSRSSAHSRYYKGRVCTHPNAEGEEESISSSSSSPNVRRYREVNVPLVEEESPEDEDEGVVVDSPSSNQTKCQRGSRSRGLYNHLNPAIVQKRQNALQKMKNRASGIPCKNETGEGNKSLIEAESYRTLSFKESAL